MALKRQPRARSGGGTADAESAIRGDASARREDGVFLKSLELKNFLSFGGSAAPLEMRPLNVIIGPNGVGKSNLVESLNLLRSAPSTSDSADILAAINAGGGVREWIWKGGDENASASIEAIVDSPFGGKDLRYHLGFSGANDRFAITDERIENHPAEGDDDFHYKFADGKSLMNVAGSLFSGVVEQDDLNERASMLSQYKSQKLYPEVTHIAHQFSSIKIYREWDVGRKSGLRRPQRTDLPIGQLLPNADNLYMVLNRLGNDPALRKDLLKLVERLDHRFKDFGLEVIAGSMQAILHDGGHVIPAPRLSSGTLRFLCLIAVLCNPESESLVCIEEPELGLYPSVLPVVADLLVDASERTQLIVTTHSRLLVDALTYTPESVVVASRGDEGTRLDRLSKADLEVWLKKCSLGDLWRIGEIG